MKIEARQVESFLRKPDAGIRGVVVYGNDEGLIAERALALAKSVCPDLKDPFRVVDISGEALKADPARLADEFAAMSLMGGRRVVRVRPAGEESAVALENLVAAPAGDALIVVEGGNLTPRSSLRTLAETEPCLAALACYMDNESTLEALVEGAARAQGMTVDDDALTWIVERLGGDRGQSRSEVDKLLLFKAGDAGKTISLADAMAVLGDTASIDQDDVISATFDGDQAALDRALQRVFDEGGNPVQLVRAVQRHVDQLHLVAGQTAKGVPMEAAIARLRFLPRFGPRREAFLRGLRLWPLPRLNAALETVFEAEIQCKSTGLPDEAIARRLCSRLCSAAASARRR